MGAMASHNTRLAIVYTTVHSATDQRKHQSSTSLAFVRGIHRWPVNYPHKWPVTRKMFPFDDVIMCSAKIKNKRWSFSHVIVFTCIWHTNWSMKFFMLWFSLNMCKYLRLYFDFDKLVTKCHYKVCGNKKREFIYNELYIPQPRDPQYERTRVHHENEIKKAVMHIIYLTKKHVVQTSPS